MKEIKFRQPIWLNCKFHGWHYWGFINGEFIGPCYDPDTSLDESQQFTGLKDRDGKEVYEGDIIGDHCVGGMRFKKVFWLQSMCMFRFDGLLGHELTKGCEQYFKIIGNIYENPELLK